jgi:hypothetical protein
MRQQKVGVERENLNGRQVRLERKGRQVEKSN